MGSGYNLPDGCYEHDLPGNSARDLALTHRVESLTDEDIEEFVGNTYVGDVIWEHDAPGQGWRWEDANGNEMSAVSERAAIRAFIGDRFAMIEDAMREQIFEEEYG